MEVKLNANLSYDSTKHTITVLEIEKKVTNKELELFIRLANNVNSLTQRSSTLNDIWGEETYFTARSMDVYITKLRKILKPLTDVKILNIHGKGYKLTVNNAYNLKPVSSGGDS